MTCTSYAQGRRKEMQMGRRRVPRPPRKRRRSGIEAECQGREHVATAERERRVSSRERGLHCRRTHSSLRAAASQEPDASRPVRARICATPNHAIIFTESMTSMRRRCGRGGWWKCTESITLVNNKLSVHRRARASDETTVTPYIIRFPKPLMWGVQM